MNGIDRLGACDVCQSAIAPGSAYSVELVVGSTPAPAAVEQEWRIGVCASCRTRLFDWLFGPPAPVTSAETRKDAA